MAATRPSSTSTQPSSYSVPASSTAQIHPLWSRRLKARPTIATAACYPYTGGRLFSIVEPRTVRGRIKREWEEEHEDFQARACRVLRGRRAFTGLAGGDRAR